jgi:dTDP-4-dehydrorhamnose reductase
MHHVHVLGCNNPLFDNLWRWRDRVATFEQSTLDDLPWAIEQISARRPEWVVYCGLAAASSWDETPLHSDNEANHVARLAHTVAEVGSRLLIVSSDRVVAGPRMFHDESEPVGEDLQSQSVRLVEQAALTPETAPQCSLVVRTNAFGWSLRGDSFAERIWRALEQGQSIELTATAFATPILASDLADVLLRCLRTRLSGVVHIGGAERTSLYRFGQELALAAGFDPRLVKASSVDADEHASCRETSLGTRLVRRELDIALPLLRESVAGFADAAINGYRNELRAAFEATVAARAA